MSTAQIRRDRFTLGSAFGKPDSRAVFTQIKVPEMRIWPEEPNTDLNFSRLRRLACTLEHLIESVPGEGEAAGGLTKVSFKPNPNFQPASREGKVLHEMAGNSR